MSSKEAPKATQEDAHRLAGELAAANASLRAATKVNALLALAAQHMPHAVLIVDAAGVVLWTNVAWEKMSSTAQDRIARRPLEEVLGAVMNTLAADQVRRLLELGRPIAVESKDMRDGAGARWFALKFEPVRNQTGGVVNFIVLVDEVTDRREAEAAQRTLEKQIFQLQKMETLGTLAGGIAHDFNNLLTGIIGNQDLALEDIDPSHPARERIEEARVATLLACELVEQILSFSRQTLGEKGSVHLEAVIEEARRFLRSTLPSSIEIVVRVDPGCGRVLADPAQLNQILLNLGTNAAHAMREGGGILSLGLAPAQLTAAQSAGHGNLPAGPYVRLTVRDTGHGMDAATLLRVFDPFFTTKSKSGGTGLGLSIVHSIVRAHGGAVEISSSLGTGTSVDIYLPVTQMVDAPEVPAAPAPLPQGGGEKICILDDEQIVAQTARLHLERLGYTVETYQSPWKFLEALRENPGLCDLLLTDQTMPEMDGLELSRNARSLAPNLPIVLMSGHVNNIPPETIEEIGRLGVVAKPFRAGDLARIVHQSLSSRLRG